MLIFVRPFVRLFGPNLSKAVNLQAMSQESVSSQKALREHLESIKRAISEQSGISQQSESTQRAFREHQESNQ